MELVIRPRTSKAVFVVIAGLGFVATGVFILKSPPHIRGETLVGWAGIVFFGLCAVIGIVSLWPGSTYLKLNDQGFTMCGMFRPHSYLWSEVGAFRVRRLLLIQKIVAFDFSEDYTRGSSLRKLNFRIGGFQAAIPNLYKKAPEEIAAIMNDYCQRAGCSA